MALTAVMSINSIFSLCLFHHSPRMPPPLWLKTLCLDHLGKLVCKDSNRSNNKVETLQPKDLNTSLASIADCQDMISYKTIKETKLTNIALPKEVMDVVLQCLRDRKEKEKEDKNEAQWRDISRIINHSSFIASIIGTLIFMIIYTTYMTMN